MKPHEFYLLALAIFIGAFSALIIWSLIVKNQLAAQLATATNTNPILNALTQV